MLPLGATHARLRKTETGRIDHPAADAAECSKCGKTLLGSYFTADRRNPSGLKSACKDCDKLSPRNFLRSVRGIKSTLPSSKLCNKCGQLFDFYANQSSVLGIGHMQDVRTFPKARRIKYASDQQI